ncbi:MAG: Holliday junction branch migration protein RuvA [Oscillospiraceae bacterium]|nr:Holliday junction branch migration protein RuvA [Oscillospiraceae bacterium]
MIYSLSGTLIHKEASLAVVECGGVGYACRTTQTTLAAIGAIGSQVMLYTHLSVRDDAVELFGFADREELSCFQMLITVSGIGPKAAISILSDLTPNRFALLVASGDSSALTKVKGIGKKSAERIVVDLKDKLAKTNPAVEGMPMNAGNATGTDNLSEALAALCVLGYRQEEVMPVLLKQSEDLSAEELIRLTLREMGRRTK